MNDEILRIIKKISSSDPDRVVFSKPAVNSSEIYRKIVIVKKVISSQQTYQIEQYTDKQVFHKNIKYDLLTEALGDFFATGYRQVNVFAPGIQMEIKLNKKGDIHVVQKNVDTPVRIQSRENNRKKSYILEEGTNIPIFEEIGIFTNEYKVRSSMQDKFRQINRFAEFVDDCLKDYVGNEINIIDFGCGKSYLTFVVYHYLTRIRGIKPNIIGLDLKADVINRCNELVQKFDYRGISFQVGDIKGYRPDFERVDMVLSLHACDTATDYALYNAIKWNTGIILSVPCCQHEVNSMLCSEKFSALTKYGLIKERFSSLVTDSIRGCMLEYSGYRTNLMEFVEIEHSPKNVLIRAVKRNISTEKRERSLAEAKRLCDEFEIRQSLMEMILKDQGI